MADERPATSFSETIKAENQADTNTGDEPTATDDSNGFRMALYGNGKRLGWMGANDKEWAILVTDVNKALVLEPYPWNGVMYYRIKGSKRYMSRSNRSQIGFYDWINARGFKLSGKNFVSDTNGQKLSYPTGGTDLYCWDAYNVLDVEFVPVLKPVIPNQPLTDLIEHIVVVMLENRSFDNMLGGLYPDKTQAEYRGLKGNETNPDPNNPGKTLTVFQGPADDATWIMPYPDPGELFTDMNEQIFGTANPALDAKPTMQGFTVNYGKQPGAPLRKHEPDVMPDPQNIMQYYSDEAVPITHFLAKQFAVCDWWFAAGPVQTLANRMFAQSGTPGLIPETNQARIDNPDFTKDWSRVPPFDPPVHDVTIFQLLDEAYSGEINWKVYHDDVAPICALNSYVYDRWKWLSWDGGNVFSFKEHLKSETNFEFDIRNSRLPKYSVIEPRYEDSFGGTVNSYHPGGAGIDFEDPNGDSLPPPISVKDGEPFLREIYEILAKYPETFKKTLLIVTYDEHGGLFDHVPPGQAVSPFVIPPDNFSYDRYGVRVPTIFVNPCIKPGTIYPSRDISDQIHFDHTSLISTVIKQFGLTGTLTPRSTAAPTLKDLIPFHHQVYPHPPPPPPPHSQREAAAANEAPEYAASAPAIDVAAIDAEAALAVVNKQEHPHALAPALFGLLSSKQRNRKEGCD